MPQSKSEETDEESLHMNHWISEINEQGLTSVVAEAELREAVTTVDGGKSTVIKQ